MAGTTNIKSGGIATFTVKAGGNSIPDELSVLPVYMAKKVNGTSRAKIVILDGDANTGKFDAGSSATFLPGTEVVIKAGYDVKNDVICKGIITRQTIRIDESVGTVLEVECRYAAFKMTAGRKASLLPKKRQRYYKPALISYF